EERPDLTSPGPTVPFPAEPTVVSEEPAELARATADPLDAQLPSLHQQFLAARRQTAEPTDEVTFERFARKVRQIRDDLKAEHRCELVDFEVHVRAGRAALKAHPVRTPSQPGI